MGPVWTPGAGLAGFILNMVMGLMVSGNIFFSQYKSMGAIMTPGAWPIMTPGAWLAGFINVGSHYTLLNTKYVSSGLMVTEKKIFEDVLAIALYKHMTPLDVASLDPRGLIGRIYVEDLTTKHCYILNI